MPYSDLWQEILSDSMLLEGGTKKLQQKEQDIIVMTKVVDLANLELFHNFALELFLVMNLGSDMLKLGWSSIILTGQHMTVGPDTVGSEFLGYLADDNKEYWAGDVLITSASHHFFPILVLGCRYDRLLPAAAFLRILCCKSFGGGLWSIFSFEPDNGGGIRWTILSLCLWSKNV
jgi:hypothetical protein